MEVWTKNVGFPVVIVTENSSSHVIKLRQNWFLQTSNVKPDEDKTLYPVFLGLRTRSGVDRILTLSDREQEFKIPSNDFFKLNAGHIGLYRALYPQERRERMSVTIAYNKQNPDKHHFFHFAMMTWTLTVVTQQIRTSYLHSSSSLLSKKHVSLPQGLIRVRKDVETFLRKLS